MYLPEPTGDPHVPPCPSRRPPMSLPEPTGGLPGSGAPTVGHRDVPRGLPGYASGATGMYLGGYRDMPWELPGYALGATGRHPPVGPGGITSDD